MKWTDVPVDVVKAVMELCDGHGIFDPKALIDAGVPQELADKFTNTYTSDFSSPKYVIYDNQTGAPVEAMQGVYGLEVLEGMIRDFGLTAPEKFGRGFQAQVWKEALQAHFAAQENAT